MTKISPFKALRPVRDKAHLVATRPYYSYKKNVLTAKLEDNPYTFLRIINPEFDKTVKKTKPNSDERFLLVKEKYAEFLQDGILFQDKEPHIYVYRQTKDGHQFTGVVAGASVEEYENDLIKKHEATLTSREAMFTNYLDIVGFNAEPVLLSHPHSEAIEECLNMYTKERPEYEFTTTDRITHELWVLSRDQGKRLQNLFQELDSTYIADGHHRSASSAGLKKLRESSGKTVYENTNHFLAFFIDERKLKILEFNRLVKGLNGLSETEFLEKLTASMTVVPCASLMKPSVEHEFTMCLNGKWYKLQCKNEVIDKSHPVNSLDAEILTRFILSPILGITDLKTDERIEFMSGAEPLTNLEEKIVKGKYSIGFILFPATVDQVKRVADNDMIMPPKSTWVEPKLRSGLTIYPINE
jgi:uncharacterized protein (DUF1015 family)